MFVCHNPVLLPPPTRLGAAPSAARLPAETRMQLAEERTDAVGVARVALKAWLSVILRALLTQHLQISTEKYAAVS